MRHCATCTCPAERLYEATSDGSDTIIKAGGLKFRVSLATVPPGSASGIWRRSGDTYEQRQPDGRTVTRITPESSEGSAR